MQWIPITRSQKSYNLNVKLGELEREDNLLMAINDVTTKTEPFFNIMKQEYADKCFYYNDRMELRFHIASEVTFVQRQVYNSFMLIGDVGGFSGFLVGLGSFIVSFLNFQNAENYVAQSLYKSNSNS